LSSVDLSLSRTPRSRTIATQGSQAGREVVSQRDDGTEVREIENRAHALVRSYQHETPSTGLLGDINVNAYDETHSHRADGLQLAEIREHIPAFVTPDLLRFLAHVTGVVTGPEMAAEAKNADLVPVLDLDVHRLPGSLSLASYYKVAVAGLLARPHLATIE
jgi:hypothetical protein